MMALSKKNENNKPEDVTDMFCGKVVRFMNSVNSRMRQQKKQTN